MAASSVRGIGLAEGWAIPYKGLLEWRRPGRPVETGLSVHDKKRRGWSWWYVLFIIQFCVPLWPPLYNRAEPTLIGIPFFYWFQLLWVLVSAVLTTVVYFATAE